MRIVLAGAHGQIARRLGPLLTRRGDTVVGIVRNPAHRADLVADGMEPVVLDLEAATVDDVSAVVAEADAVVFAEAAEWGGVPRYLLVSSIGVDLVADGATPEGVDEVFVAYLRAKLAAEQNLLAREGLGVTVLRPGWSPSPRRSKGAPCPVTTWRRCWWRCWTSAHAGRRCRACSRLIRRGGRG